MKPYADLVKLLVFVAFAGFFFWIGGVREERSWLAKENADLARLIKERDDAFKARNEAQRKADELAKLPPKVVTVVRRYPSNCALPRPVTDGLRDQVRETNAAISAAVP